MQGRNRDEMGSSSRYYLVRAGSFLTSFLEWPEIGLGEEVLVFGVMGIEGMAPAGARDWRCRRRAGCWNSVHRQWSLVLRDGEDWIQLGTG